MRGVFTTPIASRSPKLKTFTVEQYKRALDTINLTDPQREMLKAHYFSPERRATPLELALKVGKRHQNAFNSIYGRIAKQVAYSLVPNPTQWYVTYICNFPEEKPE